MNLKYIICILIRGGVVIDLFPGIKVCDVISGCHCDTCTYILIYTLVHILFKIERRWLGEGNKKHWPAVNAASQGNLSARNRFASPVVRHSLQST